MSSRTRFSSAVTDIQALLSDADPAAADLDHATRAWLVHTRQAITAQPRSPGRRWAWAAVPHRARRRRRRMLAAAGALAAAALAGALLAAPFAARGPASGRHATIGLTAAQFLNHAAAAVARQNPTAPPHPNQFVYTETATANGSLSQTWLSANGKRAGWSSPSGPIPTCAQLRKQARRSGSTPDRYCLAAMTAGYLPHLPTQPGALRRYLTRIRLINPAPPPAGSPNWAANNTGKAVDHLMATTYLRPTQRTALFRLLAHTPGFTIVPGVRDATGRPGVAIQWRYQGGTAEIIVNPKTYAYLGDRTSYPGETAKEYSGSALIKLAVADHAGQQP